MKEFAIVLCLIPALGACFSIAHIFSSAINGISRNPDSNGPLSGLALLGAAFVESVVLFSLVIGVCIMLGIGQGDSKANTSHSESITTTSVA